MEIWQWGGVAAVGLMIYKFILKQDLIGVISQGLPAAEAGLLQGILWGDQSGIEKELKQNLINSGLYHLVVASGTNVMLIASLLIENLAKILGRKKTIVMTLGVIWWYAAMVGWQIPIVRAGIMASGLYVAQIFGRKYNVWRMLVVAALIMVVAQGRVWEELSFWLTMSAMVGMLTFKADPVWYLEFKRSVWVGWWVLPVLSIGIGRVSWIGPVSNILVIESVKAVSLIGGAAMILGGNFLLICYPLLRYLRWVAEGAGGWSSSEINFNWWMAAGWYAILVGIHIKKLRMKN